MAGLPGILSVLGMLVVAAEALEVYREVPLSPGPRQPGLQQQELPGMMPFFPDHWADRAEPPGQVVVPSFPSNGSRGLEPTDGVPWADAQQTHDLAPSSPSYGPDLTELIMLAGAADNNIGLYDRRGWGKEALAFIVSSTKFCFEDHVVAFKKDSHCVAAFGAVDDAEDEAEKIAGAGAMALVGKNGEPATRAEICGFAVHIGIAAQVGSLLQSHKWKEFLELFAQPECERVTAIGHAMGGTVASVFAACANAGAEGFGNRRDFGLVTFGAFPATAEPLYSGTPGTPFVGTRYAVTGLDAGSDPWGSVPKESKAFRLEVLQFYVDAHTQLVDLQEHARKNRKSAEEFKELHRAIKELPQEEVEPYWKENGIEARVLASEVNMELIYRGMPPDPKHLALQPLLTVMVKRMAERGDLFTYFDAMPPWQSGTYMHPLMDFQPIAHPQLRPALELPRVPASPAAARLPIADTLLAKITGMVTFGPANSANCCYFKGEGACASNYFGLQAGGKSCAAPLFR